MTTVMITPTSTVITLDAVETAIREITLGGSPEGIVILAVEPGLLDVLGVEIMNRLAEDGYESLAAGCDTGRLDGLLDRAGSRGWTPEQVGILGLGRSGQLVLEAATLLEFGAAVSISATHKPEGSTGRLTDHVRGSLSTPWLGLFGSADPGADHHAITELTRTLDANSLVHSEIVRYPGVSREFYRHADQDGLSYGAWYDSWQRTIEWFGARVAPRPTPLALKWRERGANRD
ncbi:dienelactone hydrolase family protein [Gordonia polyisoprenivorans]|uniref:dienelactone hydrolase family protein n=1 Tax=Gordonia polyisoprenivorans TaxID=84595 RepID=UPI002300561A|nr:dienelactone hydrolase family protein [Gordonia polyisoprenivorans]WCB38966.1 dienelactone hydrolase family protein [Gordonia polyisoprenivorans]